MSHVAYCFAPSQLHSVLKQIVAASSRILAAAPVDDTGKFLDNGTWSTDSEALGIPLRVVYIDGNSLDSLESDLAFDLHRVLDEPAFKLTEGWHLTHDTLTRIAHLIDQVNEIHARVEAMVPGLDVTTPQSLGDAINGTAIIPAALHKPTSDQWRQTELACALRSLADLNYASHRAEGHGKSWEPGFGIVRSGDRWTITFRSYQFDDPFRDDSEYVFTGTWAEVTNQITTATEHFAQKYRVQRDGLGIGGHPLAGLTSYVMANLPDDVHLHLAPESLGVMSGPHEELLKRLDVGTDVRPMIELARYVVSVAPEYAAIGDVIGWHGE